MKTRKTHSKSRPETRIIIASTPPPGDTILIEEVISEKTRDEEWITQKEPVGTYLFLLALFLRILAMTPRRAKRS